MQTVVDGTLTNYEILNSQSKNTLLILHGWAQNSSFWIDTAKLIDSSFRIILLDLPGFGGTQNLQNESDVPEYSQFVKKFINKLSLKKFILAGHSFGGQVAGDFAIKYPEDITKLILIDAAIIRIRGPKTWIKIGITKIIKPLLSFLPTESVNSILKLYAGDYAKANAYQKSVLHHILKYNLQFKLHSIKVPTDIIWGSEDKLIPYVGKYLVENIPQAKLHVIYGAGHLLHLTHTKKLANTINEVILE